MMRARCAIGVVFHVLKASAADFTARSTSSAPHIGTRASTFCVAGSTTSRQSRALDSTSLPSRNSFTVGTACDTDLGLAAIGAPDCELSGASVRSNERTKPR